MEKLTLKQAEAALKALTSITDKLNYWNDNFNKDRYKFFVNNESVYTTISIPEKLYQKHFEPFCKTPEFTFWFLKFNAKSYFPFLLNAMDFDKKKDTPMYKEFIEAELKKIDAFEKNATELLLNDTVNIYSNRIDYKYYNEIEYLRIKNDYYKTNYLENVLVVVGQTTVSLYAKHVYIKEHLISELKRITVASAEPRQNNKDPEQTTPTTLAELFEVTDWQKYLEALTECEPKLLKNDNGKYKFIGNDKIQRGIIATWFKALRAKGIINPSFNRYTIAEVLSREIIDYRIAGSSVDNKSELYKNTFEKQLLNYVK